MQKIEKQLNVLFRCQMNRVSNVIFTYDWYEEVLRIAIMERACGKGLTVQFVRGE